MNGRDLQIKIKKAGKKQNQLARELGMDPTQWTAIFKQDDVKSGIIEKVARVLGMTVGQFYGEDNAPPATELCSCNPRLLDIIQSRDSALEKSQAQIDQLLRIIEKAK